MKNKNILVIILLLALILIGGYIWFAQTEPEGINDQEVGEDANNGLINEDINLDDNVIMARHGKFTPEVLYVAVGEEVKVLNHEDYPLSLLRGSEEIGPIPAGRMGTLTAPVGSGTYEYRSSLDESVTFNLVVEI